MSCWRRLRDWEAEGIWQSIHARVLGKLSRNDEIDLSFVARLPAPPEFAATCGQAPALRLAPDPALATEEVDLAALTRTGA